MGHLHAARRVRYISPRPSVVINGDTSSGPVRGQDGTPGVMNGDILPGAEQGQITGSGNRTGRDPGKGRGHTSSGPGPEGRDPGGRLHRVRGSGDRGTGLGEHIIGTPGQDETRPETIPHVTH